MKFIIYFLLSFAIGWDVLQADQRNPELPDLFSQLEQAGTSYTASPIVQNIWTIWLKHSDSQLTQAMKAASEIMQNGDLEQAELLFTQLIEKAPGWAEVWNKRATIRYYRDNLVGSIADIKETLVLEPRHFGALSGLGMIQMRLQNYSQALSTYESLQKIHPNSQDIGKILPALRQQLSQQYL
jgi:tetratricopeptide (TPR) repeat protein